MLTVRSVEIRDMATWDLPAARSMSSRKELVFPSETLASSTSWSRRLEQTRTVHYDGATLHIGTQTDHDDILELLYLDRGPGIYDIDRVVRDGVSTSGGVSVRELGRFGG